METPAIPTKPTLYCHQDRMCDANFKKQIIPEHVFEERLTRKQSLPYVPSYAPPTQTEDENPMPRITRAASQYIPAREKTGFLSGKKNHAFRFKRLLKILHEDLGLESKTLERKEKHAEEVTETSEASSDYSLISSDYPEYTHVRSKQVRVDELSQLQIPELRNPQATNVQVSRPLQTASPQSVIPDQIPRSDKNANHQSMPYHIPRPYRQTNPQSVLRNENPGLITTSSPESVPPVIPDKKKAVPVQDTGRKHRRLRRLLFPVDSA